VRFYNRTRRTPQVMIVSLIDIFAILLIFVIVTTTFKKAQPEQPQVTIKLPESKSAVASDQPNPPVVLTISAEEELFLDEKKIAIDQLAPRIEQLRQDQTKLTIALNADDKVSWGFLVKVADALKEGGIEGSLSAFTEAKK
jgi:biopolymer transport protein ExbD